MYSFGALFILFLWCFTYPARAAAGTVINSTEIVNTAFGLVRGKRVRLATDKIIDQFLGVPFANAARFEAPISPDKWNTTLNATSYGKACPQPVRIVEIADMSEDCLFLNIYRPARSNGRLFPVMHFIHGGALVFGSAANPDASVLASEEGVIVVSSNYRLGALGFLATGEDGFRGNYGMLDQVRAMSWVQQNIQNFGGDPRNVTLFGQSAGAFSVSLLMLSPLTNGMFQNVILQSGSAVSLVSTLEMTEARERAREFGELLGCQDMSELKSCLKERNFTDLEEAQLKLKRLTLFRPFSAVVDGYVLPDSPKTLFSQGKVNGTNLMIGINKDEGGRYMLFGIPGVINPISGIRQGMSRDTFTSLATNNTWIRQQNEHVVNSIVFEYTDYSDLSNPNTTRKGYEELLSDSSLRAPAILTAQFFAMANFTTYFYQLEHALTNASFGEVPPWMAVFHGADLAFVFGVPLNNNETQSNDTNVLFSRDIMRMWGNFARTGNPTPENSPLEWPRYTLQTQNYMALKPQFEVKSKLQAKRMVFWNEILPNQAGEPIPILKPTETESESSDDVILGLSIALAIIAILLFVLLLVFVCLTIKRRRKRKLKLEY